MSMGKSTPTRINSSIVKKLYFPPPGTHKGENGRLLVVAGSEKYHGSLLYALKAASKIVDLIFVLTTKENRELVKKLKSKTAEFIPVGNSPFPSLIKEGGRGEFYDCILIGPGMGVSKRTHKMVETVLKSKAKAVLDADALNVLDKKLLKLLHSSVILTPHPGEFKKVFGMDKKPTIVGKLSRKFGCTILLKGKVDAIATPSGKIILDNTGNQGMTKGGTGDVLAGLVAAFFCKNNAFISAAAGAYLNGKAGDELYRKVGPYYNAEDLVEQIPKTLWNLVK